MEFDNQYLTYNEYKKLGGTLEEMPFNLLEFNARKQIDKETFGRLTGIGQNYQEVKLCIYNLISTLKSYNEYETQNKSISSESTDGYSVSYGTPQKTITEAKESELNSNIESYLSNLEINNIPVLYRGADVNK